MRLPCRSHLYVELPGVAKYHQHFNWTYSIECKHCHSPRSEIEAVANLVDLPEWQPGARLNGKRCKAATCRNGQQRRESPGQNICARGDRSRELSSAAPVGADPASPGLRRSEPAFLTIDVSCAMSGSVAWGFVLIPVAAPFPNRLPCMSQKPLSWSGAESRRVRAAHVPGGLPKPGVLAELCLIIAEAELRLTSRLAGISPLCLGRQFILPAARQPSGLMLVRVELSAKLD